jgi:hypothetical protein
LGVIAPKPSVIMPTSDGTDPGHHALGLRHARPTTRPADAELR